MNAVASFKHKTSLMTDKEINLINGLNGTSKSIISNFLYEPQDLTFAQCRKTLEQSAPILVYNQKFIRDNFFVADNLKGIFSLSKENAAAEQTILEATEKQSELEQSLQSKIYSKEQVRKELSKQKLNAVEEIWYIKNTYSGGDRVLEYCLEGLKDQKEKLLCHLQAIPKPISKPNKATQALRQEVEALKGDGAQQQQRRETLTFQSHEVESDQIFGTFTNAKIKID